MDKWEDYPIKVLGIAPLVMVVLPTVSSFSSTCGCFLRVERSFSQTISLLFSLYLVDGFSGEWRHLHILGLKNLRVQGKGGGGGRTDPPSGPGLPDRADRPRRILARFGRPFAPVGPHVFMHFAPSTCTILTMPSLRPRWRFSLHEVRSFKLQSSGMLLCNTSVLATFGSDFIKLLNTNETP
jgi:hypothetical protein